MSQDSIITTESKRNIWVRGLYMLLMVLAYQLSGTLMFIVAIFQFLVTLINDTPNTRLLSFGRNLGRYFQQIVYFLTFASEEVPFPFNDWPSGD
ncbi:DUF4389 domain-containing protein [Candidatus Nitrotoga sp. 1052]|uniref:DUF4389 domain-containing protein n=1 Tax=Candidatus Nitrotoga sp. 1052 TaxID=2886964 RepID=UPI001EF6165A|nr:DUF4389 domain-containing protein [Candidatus Nitrotoga sp. 1052]CAH1091688.1 conserved hypothetical protein [Candidatus Nitrotoga sp. 1052]